MRGFRGRKGCPVREATSLLRQSPGRRALLSLLVTSPTSKSRPVLETLLLGFYTRIVPHSPTPIDQSPTASRKRSSDHPPSTVRRHKAQSYSLTSSYSKPSNPPPKPVPELLEDPHTGLHLAKAMGEITGTPVQNPPMAVDQTEVPMIRIAVSKC